MISDILVNRNVVSVSMLHNFSVYALMRMNINFYSNTIYWIDCLNLVNSRSIPAVPFIISFLDAIASLLSTQECYLLTFLKNQLMQQLMILIDLT